MELLGQHGDEGRVAEHAACAVQEDDRLPRLTRRQVVQLDVANPRHALEHRLAHRARAWGMTSRANSSIERSLFGRGRPGTWKMQLMTPAPISSPNLFSCLTTLSGPPATIWPSSICSSRLRVNS